MIVVFTTPAMGHLKPMLPLLAGLVGAGQKLVCLGHHAFEDIIGSTGAEFSPYPDVAYDIDAPDFNLVQMGADLINASHVIYPALLPHITALSPRLIVQDFMALWGSRIGTALGVPRVHTVPTIVFNREAQRRMRREDGLAKLAGDVARGLPALAGAMARTRFAVTIGEAFGIEDSWKRLSPPVCELVFSLEELQVGQPEGPVRRTYIGPTVNDLRSFEPTGLPQGYVLVTFGTLSNNLTERFEAAIRGAFLSGLSVVVQCGRKVDVARLRALVASLELAHPQQWGRVIESVSDLEALIMNAEIVIHHAGMATTWETVRFRKPALFIPTIADQKVLASTLDDLGVGVRLPRGREFDAMAIASGIQRLRGKVCDWGTVEELLAKAGGASRGVRLVLNILDAVR